MLSKWRDVKNVLRVVTLLTKYLYNFIHHEFSLIYGCISDKGVID